MLGEFLNLLSAVTATALASNFYGLITQWVGPWWAGDPSALAFVSFFALLGGVVLLFHAAIRKVTDFLKWERLHWTIQGVGLLFGALRGVWWSGVVLLILLACGSPYLTDSVEKRSLLASRLFPIAQSSIRWTVDHYPGGLNRKALVPPIVIRLPQLPPELRSNEGSQGPR